MAQLEYGIINQDSVLLKRYIKKAIKLQSTDLDLDNLIETATNIIT